MKHIIYWLYIFILLNIVIQIQSKIRYATYVTPKPTRKVELEPQLLSKTCLLEPDSGPCRADIKMWFYQPSSTNCTVFSWGGCQGNGNRFNTYGECINTCVSGPGWKASQPRYCSLTFDYGWCFGAEKRYYFDRLWKVCKSTIYSGCGGNKNNFSNKEQCDQICRFGKLPLVATLPPVWKDGLKKILIIDPIGKNKIH